MNLTLKDFEDAIAKHGSGRKAAKALGLARTTFQDRYAQLKKDSFASKINVARKVIESGDKPKYFLITSAQDGTKVHKEFLENLESYAEYLDADIIVSGFTYGKSLFEDHAKANASFASEISKYMTNDRIILGNDLMVCCEMNTLPTAVNPLSGFHNYTGIRSGIFPHPKVQLESIPTMKTEATKILMTTGAVTLPNYVPKKAGIKAEHHHIIGAVIVEIDSEGGYFARHLIADKSGDFYDLDRRVKGGKVTLGNRAEALTFGDIHRNKLDPLTALGLWGSEVSTRIFMGDKDKDSKIDKILNAPVYKSLRARMSPAQVFYHDILDFEVRNHHNINDHLFRFRQLAKNETVEEEISKVATFIEETALPDVTTVIVESNHDLAFERWLKEGNYKSDPANAIYFLECSLKLYKNAHIDKYSILAAELISRVDPLLNVVYLNQDESYKICIWDKGGIECGLHGHNGLNGARSSPKSFTKLGTRANTGHTHSAGIIEGVYTAGVSADLEMGYNIGPSSWSHSHIVTYANGKRAIVTQDSLGRYTTFD